MIELEARPGPATAHGHRRRVLQASRRLWLGQRYHVVTRSGDDEKACEWGRPERASPIEHRGNTPRKTSPLHATQDLGDDDLANHRDRVDQRVTESHARVGVGAAVREGEDCGLRLRAAQ